VEQTMVHSFIISLMRYTEKVIICQLW